MLVNTICCPRCGSQMAVRMKSVSSSIGELFWGCSNFPTCRHTSPLISIPIFKDSKKLHQAIYNSVWGNNNYHNGFKRFSAENLSQVHNILPQYSDEELLIWGLNQLEIYQPGDLHNHDLGVGSPHTESLAGFVAYLLAKFPLNQFPDNKIPAEWTKIINDQRI